VSKNLGSATQYIANSNEIEDFKVKKQEKVEFIKEESYESKH